MDALILQPVVGLIGLACLLFTWLTVARTLAVRRGTVRYDVFVLGREEPREIARITRNLANFFEVPVLFVACVAILIALDVVNGYDVAFAWLFLAGRVVHTLVQTLTDNVPLRGQVFMVNFIGFLGIAGHLALVSVGLA